MQQIDPFDAARAATLEPMLRAAEVDGFTDAALRRAAAEAAIAPAAAAAAFPDGPIDVIAYWSRAADAAAARAAQTPGRIRERVARAVEARIDFIEPHKPAARQAAARLALPQNAGLAAGLAWRSADAIWRALGDRSLDANYYSKRTILAGVVVSVNARWLGDDDPDRAATRRFLDARIDNVMQFEKVKARVQKWGVDPSKAIAGLARLRYPKI